jgi:hypothetical protein
MNPTGRYDNQVAFVILGLPARCSRRKMNSASSLFQVF